MVLGHSECGAVKAALETKEQASARVDPWIWSAWLIQARRRDLDRAIAANVRSGVVRLKTLEPTTQPLRRDETGQGGRRGL